MKLHLTGIREKQLLPLADMQLFASEMDFLKDMQMSYHIGGDAFLLSFCLGDDIDWTDQGDHKDYCVQDGQYTIYRKSEYREERIFAKAGIIWE